jgi:hypothetical protein
MGGERAASDPPRPVASRRPPVMVAPPPGSILEYQQPRRRKSLPRRIINHVRYHYEDRAGNLIMWIVGPLCIAALLFIWRPSFWIMVMRLLNHG